MERFHRLFNGNTLLSRVIAMIHVDSLPGTPKYCGNFEKILNKACEEAELYENCKVDSIMIENMHDIPYIQSKYFEPEVTASMTRICTDVRKIFPKHKPIGIQVLAGGNKEALAIAKVCGLQFIRVEGFVFSHIGDEGFMDANAGRLLRYRKKIEADDILVFTDIKKKHSSHAITSDLSITDVAKSAEFFMSDGLILTGSSTGDPANVEELESVKGVTKLPILIGSGVTGGNLYNYAEADGLIVGSHFKKFGRWENDIERDHVLRFMENVFKLRDNKRVGNES